MDGLINGTSLASRPLLRSCEACRSSKSKCIPSEEPNNRSCQRCTKLSKTCNFSFAQPRPKRGKQLKPTGRVAAVEKKVDDIHAILQNLQSSGRNRSSSHQPSSSVPVSQSQSPNDGSDVRSDTAPSLVHSHHTQSDCIATPLQGAFVPSGLKESRQDVFQKGILTGEEGNDLLDVFKGMDTGLHFIQPARLANINALRSNSPFTLLAILNTASHKRHALHPRLDQELREDLGRRVMVEGEKSLDVLQGMMVYLAWYHLHFHPQRQQMYQFVSLATAMAVDLGLDRSPRKQHASSHSHSPFDPDRPNPELATPLEEKRTSVACYFLCSSLCLALRRPNSFRYNDYLEECCIQLASRKELFSDEHLTHSVRLQRLAEEANDTFGYSTNGAPQMGPEMIGHTVHALDKRIQSLRFSFPDDASKMVTLQLAFHNANIFIHEVALHADLSSTHFESGSASNPHLQPHAVTSSVSPSARRVPSPPTPASLLTPILLATLDACRSCLSYFLSIPAPVFGSVGLVDITRIVYAIIVLGKLALNPTLTAVLSGMNTDTQLSMYLDAVISKSSEVVGRDEDGREVKDAFFHFRRVCEGTKSWYEGRVRRGNGNMNGNGHGNGNGANGMNGHVQGMTGGQISQGHAGVGMSGKEGDMEPIQILETTCDGQEQIPAPMFDPQEGMPWVADDGFWEDMMSAWPVGMEGVMPMMN